MPRILLILLVLASAFLIPNTRFFASTDVIFNFTAPKAKKVKLYGSFNGWSKGYLLVKKDSALWAQSLPLLRGRYEYKYLVDGKWMYNKKLPTINDGLLSKNNVIIIR